MCDKYMNTIIECKQLNNMEILHKNLQMETPIQHSLMIKLCKSSIHENRFFYIPEIVGIKTQANIFPGVV